MHIYTYTHSHTRYNNKEKEAINLRRNEWTWVCYLRESFTVPFWKFWNLQQVGFEFTKICLPLSLSGCIKVCSTVSGDVYFN